MRNENNVPCEFCKDKVSGDNFFTTSNDYCSGFNFKRHSMQYCPKCGRKLPESGVNVTVIPFPQKPFPKAKRQPNLALVQ